jgi:4-hydroxy-tetrahydrodipicolinate synthase
MQNRLKGVWAAALTPQKADLSAETAAMVAHHKWLLANGCDGVALGGTTGEANSFSVSERRELIDAVQAAGIAGDQMMVGVGCCAIPDTVELTKASLAAGYGNVLMLPPFYYKGVSDDGLFAAYAEVISRVADERLRIYVYDFPKMTGLEISTELLVRLNDAFPNTIVGVKDSSGRVEDMLAVCEAIPGFGTFAGTEQFLLPVLQAGGAGCISATANVTCAVSAAVYQAYLADNGDGEAAQERATAVRLMLQAYGAIPSMKEAMAVHTGNPAWRHMRPPMVPMATDAAAKLAGDMAALGFTLPLAA